MATWEYKILEPLTMKLNKSEDVEKYLNSLGQQRWELVSVTCVGSYEPIYSTYYLKRPKS